MAVKRYNGSDWDTVAGVGAQGATGASGTAPLTTKGDLLGFDTAANRVAVGTNGQVLTADSTACTFVAWATLATIPTIKSVRKSADQSVTSNTTVANDTHLKFAVAASETYIFNIWLYIYAADATPDIKLTCTGPSGSTVLWSPGQATYLPDATPTVGTVQASGVTASYFVDANLRPLVLQGTILNSATAGDLTLQWAQNTSSATATTIKAGSYIIATKVA